MELKTLVVQLANASIVEKNKRVIVLETYQCNRPKGVEELQGPHKFQRSLNVSSGCCGERGGGAKNL